MANKSFSAGLRKHLLMSACVGNLLLRILLVLMLLFFHSLVVRALGGDEETAQRARELLALSDEQNYKDHSLALETARQALELWQGLGDSAGIAQAHSQIARCYLAKSDLPEAEQNYAAALQLWRQQNNSTEQAAALIMLGYVEERKGEWLNAISYFSQAQPLVNEQTDPGQMAQIASGLAGLFNDTGMPESALVQYQRALDYFRQAQVPRGVNRMIMAIGYTSFLLGDYATSRTNLEQALATFDPADLDAAECHEYLAQLEIANGEFAAGLQHLQPTLAIYEHAGNLNEAARVRALIGQAYEQEGSLARARPRYMQALNTFRGVGDRVSEAAVCFALGRLELKNGNYEDAETYLKQSIENTEDIRSVSTGRDLTAAFSASVQERYEAYIECLMRKHKSQPSLGADVLAFQASELARARSLAELLRDTHTNLLAGVDPGLSEHERSLRQAIRSKLDYRIALLGTAYKREELDKVETELARLRDEYKQVTDQIRILDPSYDRISQPTAYSLREIQEQVIKDDQVVLLEYFLGTNASYVWRVSRRDMRVYELPKAAVITESVRRVYDLLSIDPDMDTDSRLKKATSELANMVLGPLADQLTTRQVIVAADGALNYIPFQLLAVPSENREPLVAGYEVVNAPSASILGQLRQERAKHQPPEKLLAAFGDPVFVRNYAQFRNSSAGELQASVKGNEAEPWRRAWRDIEVSGDAFDPSVIEPLFFSKHELANLRDIAGTGSLVVTGFAASRETLERTDFSKYAILHFATHGLLDPKSPENSGFFLSMVDASGHPQDGFITMQDIYGLHAPVDLVVLSSCRTALGKNVRGEGLIGLTRAFMYAGASSVAASLWKVDDEATAELMKNFYANMLQKGMTPAAALRAAQNTIRQKPEWRSPHYWAGFTLQGEYRETIKAPAISTSRLSQKTLAGGLLVVVVLSGAGWWYRKRRGFRAAVE